MGNIIEKKALKGACGLRLWPVLQNTVTSYIVGAAIAMPELQSLTKEVQKEEYTIYADDCIYDTGAEYKYEDLTVTLAELPPDLEAKLQGSDYNEETGIYTFATSDIAPEYAMGYAALNISEQYRMFVHFSVKLMSVKVDHKTKGTGNDGQPYTLTFRNMQKKQGGGIRIQKDGNDGTYSWLDTALDQYKEQSQPAQEG